MQVEGRCLILLVLDLHHPSASAISSSSGSLPFLALKEADSLSSLILS
jgi:hypothetical protein